MPTKDEERLLRLARFTDGMVTNVGAEGGLVFILPFNVL